jgi:hypothetical protein
LTPLPARTILAFMDQHWNELTVQQGSMAAVELCSKRNGEFVNASMEDVPRLHWWSCGVSQASTSTDGEHAPTR